MTIPRDTTTWERFVTRAREGTGEHAFDCRILLHAPGTDLHAISKQAMEAQHPLLPVITNRLEPKAVRTLPPERSFFSISDVQLSAFYRDRGRTILRVYEPAGRADTVRITLPAAPKSVREVDFNGSPRPRRIELSGTALNFAISRWEIVTLEITG
jgi:alpha-mannosidase